MGDVPNVAQPVKMTTSEILTQKCINDILEKHNPQIQEGIKGDHQFSYLELLCGDLKIPESFKEVYNYTLDMYLHYRLEHGNYLSQISSLQDGTIEAYELRYIKDNGLKYE